MGLRGGSREIEGAHVPDPVVESPEQPGTACL